MSEIERPDLSDMTTEDLIGLMAACGLSNDPSDQQFSKFCRDEIARRKPKSARSPDTTPKGKS